MCARVCVCVCVSELYRVLAVALRALRQHIEAHEIQLREDPMAIPPAVNDRGEAEDAQANHHGLDHECGLLCHRQHEELVEAKAQPHRQAGRPHDHRDRRQQQRQLARREPERHRGRLHQLEGARSKSLLARPAGRVLDRERASLFARDHHAAPARAGSLGAVDLDDVALARDAPDRPEAQRGDAQRALDRVGQRAHGAVEVEPREHGEEQRVGRGGAAAGTLGEAVGGKVAAGRRERAYRDDRQVQEERADPVEPEQLEQGIDRREHRREAEASDFLERLPAQRAVAEDRDVRHFEALPELVRVEVSPDEERVDRAEQPERQEELQRPVPLRWQRQAGGGLGPAAARRRRSSRG